MRTFTFIALAVAAVCLAVAVPLTGAALIAYPALAQAVVTDSRVSFDPFIAEVLPYLLALFSAIITAAIAWATKKLTDWTGINIEAKHREALQSALLNGARATLARHTPHNVVLDMKSVPIKEGVEFVLNSVPDAVRYFGLSPDDIEKHLTPKLVALTGSK